MPTVAEESIDAFQNYYARPPERPKKKSLKQMVYDADNQEYFGRTVESWGKLYDFKRVYVNDNAIYMSIVNISLKRELN